MALSSKTSSTITSESKTNATLDAIRKKRQQRQQKGRRKGVTARPHQHGSSTGGGRDDMAVIVVIFFGVFWFVGFFVIIIAKLPDVHHQHEIEELAEEVTHVGPANLFKKLRWKNIKNAFNANKNIKNNNKNDNKSSLLSSTEKASPSFVNKFPPEFPIITRTGTKNSEISKDALDMCHRTLWHTLETTTIVLPNDETFIHTGDIDDLWLRDSAAQIHPLLVPFFDLSSSNSNNENEEIQKVIKAIPKSNTDNNNKELLSLVQIDKKLKRIVSGLIKRTAMYIRHDPYANAFRIDDTYKFNAEQKRMGRHDLISTWNYELDSACYYIRMIYYYYKSFPSSKMLRRETTIKEAISIMIDLWIAEQKHEDDSYPTGDLFDCINCNKPYRYPGLERNGKGSPTNSSSGLTWTGFRPSDDECKYGFLIPANMFAIVVLRYVIEMAPILGWDNNNDSSKNDNDNNSIVSRATKLANDIERGINEHGIVDHPTHGKIYAYEVDGNGNYLLMDDANVPSLMSIPYLNYNNYDKDVYDNTRKFILSNDNPTFQHGYNKESGVIEGYGSPHMKQAISSNIWPMSLAIQGLTSPNITEKVILVDKLVKSTGNKGWMHESFDVSNPHKFTRSWFCWADSLFAELVMSISSECPVPINDALHKYHIMEWRDVGNEFHGSIFEGNTV